METKPQKLKPESSNLKASLILVSGSLTYDFISNLKGTINEVIQIENGVLGKQNLMFTAGENTKQFGGTGGNICYGLGQLKESSILISMAGDDFAPYEKHLKQSLVTLKVKRDKGETASFTALKDEKDEQIGIYRPNVSKYIGKLKLTDTISESALSKIACAIFSPGTAKSISKQLSEFRRINKDAFTIFDPGQMLAIDFTEDLLKKCLKNSDILIVNDTEANILHNKFKFDLKKIFSFGLTYIIETKGGDGSVLYELIDGEIIETKISAIKVNKIIDPTGAGDAFRAGIIYGIVNDLDIEKSMQLASRMGALCVKQNGGQSYKI